MDGDLIAKLVAALTVIGGALYGTYRMIKRDRRDDKVATIHDDAIEQLIKNLRDEVDRLSIRLAAVEEQNRKCEERNDELHAEILELKLKLHVT